MTTRSSPQRGWLHSRPVLLARVYIRCACAISTVCHLHCVPSPLCAISTVCHLHCVPSPLCAISTVCHLHCVPSPLCVCHLHCGISSLAISSVPAQVCQLCGALAWLLLLQLIKHADDQLAMHVGTSVWLSMPRCCLLAAAGACQQLVPACAQRQAPRGPMAVHYHRLPPCNLQIADAHVPTC
jgi:hypothetical protein